MKTIRRSGLGFAAGLVKSINRAGRFSYKAARDITQKRMQHDLLLQRAGHKHVDLLPSERAQNSFGRISFFIMNRCIGRKLDLRRPS